MIFIINKYLFTFISFKKGIYNDLSIRYSVTK